MRTRSGLHAEDLDRAEAFYRDVLGARFVARYEPPGLLFFDLGGVRLLVEHGAPSSLLYLRVSDIDAAWTDRFRWDAACLAGQDELVDGARSRARQGQRVGGTSARSGCTDAPNLELGAPVHVFGAHMPPTS